jgi:hypothetical protein
MLPSLSVLTLLLLAPLRPGAAVEDPPAPRLSAGGWVEYLPGDTPLVLLAPHGGAERPSQVRDRREGVKLADSRTRELTLELASAFEEQTGRRPHVILCHLHRSKLDVNRDQAEAAQGDAGALQAWRAWHTFVEEASVTVVRAHGHGLIIDVHGQSHDEGWVEWGYALTSRQLALDDGELAVGERPLGSTVDALARRHGGARAALVRGPQSLGGLAHTAGYKSVPSPAHPHPDGGRYFNGGYNVRRHGSRAEGSIDAVQMEVPRHLRLEAPDRRRFASDVAGCLVKYLVRWYGFTPVRSEDQR